MRAVDLRLASGGVEEDLDVAGVGAVPARFERCPAGWQATFTIRAPEPADLSLVHRLVAPTLAEARRAVPSAVQFLLGQPLDEPFLPL